MKLDFDKIFTLPMTGLYICRAHPCIKRDTKWALQYLIIQGLFTITFGNIVYNIIYFDLKANDFTQTSKNGVLSVVYLAITFQSCILLRYPAPLVELINFMKRDYEQSKHLTSEEKEVMYKYVRQSLRVCKQWLVIASCGTGTFIAKNVLTMIYYYFNYEAHLVPIYEWIYPSFIEKNKESVHMYVLIWAMTFFYASYSSLVYAAFVPLGPIFILHACAQLELVENRINVLFEECDNQVIKDKLKSIIMQLQYIYSFVDLINTVFMVAYELTLKASTLMLPVTFYALIEEFKRGRVTLEFITFIVGGTMISSSPCYYSDLLMDKGECVRHALYTCGWEKHYDHRSRTTIQLMLQRALQPIAIRTVFRNLCLDALTDLFQQSYTLFNLMNAMWN